MQQIVCDVCGVVKKGRAPNWSVILTDRDEGHRKDYCPEHSVAADVERVQRAASIHERSIEIDVGIASGTCSLATMGARMSRLSHILLARGIDDEHADFDVYDDCSIIVRFVCNLAGRDELAELIEATLAGNVDAETERG